MNKHIISDTLALRAKIAKRVRELISGNGPERLLWAAMRLLHRLANLTGVSLFYALKVQ